MIGRIHDAHKKYAISQECQAVLSVFFAYQLECCVVTCLGEKYNVLLPKKSCCVKLGSVVNNEQQGVVTLF